LDDAVRPAVSIPCCPSSATGPAPGEGAGWPPAVGS